MNDAIQDVSPETHPMIFRLLADRGYRIRTLPRIPPCDPALDALALLVSFHFEACREFLRHMRGEMRANPGFHVSVAGMSGEQIVLLRNLCSLFRSNGLLAHYWVDPANERIVGAVEDSDRAFHFIGGGWLESAIRVNVSQFLNLDGTPVELLENVEIRRPDGRNFELDTVMAIDGALYWWESKCGGYLASDLDRYRAVAKKLALTAPFTLRTRPLPDAAAEDGQVEKLVASAKQSCTRTRAEVTQEFNDASRRGSGPKPDHTMKPVQVIIVEKDPVVASRLLALAIGGYCMFTNDLRDLVACRRTLPKLPVLVLMNEKIEPADPSHLLESLLAEYDTCLLSYSIDSGNGSGLSGKASYQERVYLTEGLTLDDLEVHSKPRPPPIGLRPYSKPS